ncbi:DUF4232 domain-containing protein [Streptomyces sp. NPDC050560]|uniref:DUF4232 domain-containing protein n=1 Tax=Streptomyces sp. NPDC050560 TaxID=3365630 RepID=UPI0037A38171
MDMTNGAERDGRTTGTWLKHPGRAAATAVAVAAVTGLALTGVAQAASPSAASAPTCGVSDLDASLGKDLAGGMNHQGVVLHLENTSGKTCDLLGYPGLGLEDSDHTPLTSDTTWGTTWYADDPGKAVLKLAPGQSAEAVIAWTHANVDTSDGTHAAYLEVTPPASTGHKTVKFDNWVDNGQLTVTSLARTVDLRG